MAYIGFVGDGYVGNFLSTGALEAQYPAQRFAGRKATVETAGVVAWYFSTGGSWTVMNGSGSGVAAVGNRSAFPGQTATVAAVSRISTFTARISAATGFTNVRAYFPGYFINNGGTVAATSDLQVGFAIRKANGTYYRATFSGANLAAITAGQGAWSDPIAGLHLDAGETVRYLTADTAPTSGLQRLTAMGSQTYRQEGSVNTDQTTAENCLSGTYGRDCTATCTRDNTTGFLSAPVVTSPGTGWGGASSVLAVDPVDGTVLTVGNTNSAHTTISFTANATGRFWNPGTYLVIPDSIATTTAGYGPAVVVGTPDVATESYLIIGDSNGRGYGAGDGAGDFKANYGSIETFIDNNYGFVNLSVIGNTAAAYADDASGATTKLNAVLSSVNFVPTRTIVALGTNDMATPLFYSDTLVSGKITTIGSYWKTKGSKVYPATLPPRTDAGNTAAVTGFTAGGAKELFNGKVKAKTAYVNADGYYDNSTGSEQAGDTTLWITSPVSTTDGTHQTRACNLAVKATNPLKTLP